MRKLFCCGTKKPKKDVSPELPRIEDDKKDKNAEIGFEGEELLLRLKDLEKNVAVCIQEQDKLKDQDLALLIGSTGAGKSTTINYLSGKRFKKENDEYQVIGDPLAEIGHDFSSKTRCIISYQAPSNRLHICDTPGFQDTKGFEADLMNSQLIIKTIQSAKSARFILLLSPDQFSKSGRCEQFKKVMDQCLKLFGCIPDFKNSIKLAFTHIDKGEEKKQINKIAQGLQKLLSDVKEDSAQFINWMIEQIDDKEEKMKYLIIHPQEHGEILKIVDIIQKTIPLSRNQLKNMTPINLSNDSQAHLDTFLTQCQRDMISKLDSLNLVKGLEFFKCLHSLKSNLSYKPFETCFQQSLQDLNKMQHMSDFRLELKDFKKEVVFNSEKAQEVLNLIQKVLQNSIITEIVKAMDNHNNNSNNLLGINSKIEHLRSYERQLLQMCIESDKLEVKYSHFQKLEYLHNNHKLMINSEQLEYFKNKFQLNEFSSLGSPLFSVEVYQQTLKHLSDSCQATNDAIQNIIDNNLQQSNVNQLLSNLQFCNENGLNSRLQMNIIKRIDHQRILEILSYKMQQMHTQLINIQGKIWNGLQKDQLITEKFEINTVNQYLFIEFMLSESKTSSHFQCQTIQQPYAKLQTILKDTIKQCLEKGFKMKDYKSLLPYQQFISLFRNMNNQLWSQITDSTAYITYQRNVEEIFYFEKEKYQNLFDKVKEDIEDYIKNSNEIVILDKIKDDFSECTDYLLSLENIKEWCSKGQQLKSEYTALLEPYSEFISSLEEGINLQILNLLPVNFKKIQILLTAHRQNSNSYSESIRSLLSKQKQFTSFVAMISNQLKKLTEDQSVENNSLFSNSLQEANNKLSDLNIYKSFMEHYNSKIEYLIHQIQKNWNLKQSTIELLDKNSHQKYFNNIDSQNWLKAIKAIDDLTSFMDIAEENLNQRMKTIKPMIKQYFGQVNKFDVENTKNMFANIELHEIRPIFDQMKTIKENHPQIAGYLDPNIYQDIQNELSDYLKSWQTDLMYQQTHTTESKKKGQQFNELYDQMKEYLPSNIQSELKIQEHKFQAQEKKVNSLLINHVQNNNFKEAKDLIEGASDEQKDIIHKMLEQKIEGFMNTLKRITEDPQESLKQPAQEEMIKTLYHFEEVFKHFDQFVSGAKKEQIQQTQTNYTTNLIEKFFYNLDHHSIKNELTLIKSLVINYLFKLEKMKESEFIFQEKQKIKEAFTQKIRGKFQEITNFIELEGKRVGQEELINQIELIYLIENECKALDFNDILSHCKFSENKKQFYKKSLEVIKKKTNLFINQQFRINKTEALNYMKKFIPQICKTFEKVQKDLEKKMEKFLKEIESQVQKVIENIKSADKKRILEEYDRNPTSILVKDNISMLTLRLKDDIIKSINCNDKSAINKQKQKIQEMHKYFNQTDTYIFELFNNLKQGIIQEILDKWNKLQSLDSLNNQSISEVLSLVLYIDNVNQWCDYKECLSKCGTPDLVSRIYNIILQRKNKIQSAVDKLDHEEVTNHHHSLSLIKSNKVSYANKKMNIFEIFQKQQQLYYNQLKQVEREKYESLVTEFSDMSQLFLTPITNKQSKILQQLDELFESNQLKKIHEMQHNFIEFCRKINQKSMIIKDFEKVSKFIYEWVEQKYDKIYEEALAIKDGGEIKSKRTIEILRQIESIEKEFGKSQESIAKKNLSQKVIEVAKSQYDLLLQNMRVILTDFNSVDQRKLFVSQLVEVYYFAAAFLKPDEMKLQMRELIEMVKN